MIGVGVHINIIYSMFVNQKKLNRIDSPFQTFAVGLLVEFIIGAETNFNGSLVSMNLCQMTHKCCYYS